MTQNTTQQKTEAKPIFDQTFEKKVCAYYALKLQHRYNKSISGIPDFEPEFIENTDLIGVDNA